MEVVRPLQIASRQPTEELSKSDLCEQLLDNEFSLEKMEQQLIRSATEHADDNVSQAALLLGMTRPQLAYRLKKLATDEVVS